MTHPEELLAGYVDGTLSAQDRAVVDAHLTTCDDAGGEVAQARVAVAALGGLPEAPAPAGLGAKAMAELGRTAASAGPPPRLAGSVGGTRCGGGSDRPGRRGGAAQDPGRRGRPADGASAAASRHRVGSASIQPQVLTPRLRRRPTQPARLRRGAKLATVAGGRRARSRHGPPYRQPDASGSGADAQTALSCLQKAFPGFPGTDQADQATFQGNPLTSGSTRTCAGRRAPAEHVSVRVAAIDGCPC